jgi:hypothetical protein
MRTSLLAIAALIGIAAAAPVAAQTTASVKVSVIQPIGTIPPMAYGVNTAVWDGVLTDPDVPSLLQAVGTTALRYPGGSTSDVYHWQTNSYTGGGSGYSQDDFDGFMTSVAQPVGASPIITVNYGSNIAGTAGGDPNEAAAWVDYANNVRHYGVKYWEIGNEIYGNGEYDGVQWEEDLHSSHAPTTYGENVVAFAKAMKAQDPSIKIGAVVALPGYWPEGVAPDWNNGVLSKCGKNIDFVILHWYPQGPGGESDSFLLSSTSQIPAIVAATRKLVDKYCGENAPNVQILVTETNSVSSDPGRQSVSLIDGLFVADNYMTWLEHGVASVDLWALHNGAALGNNSPDLYGTTFYGDYGMLADEGAPEPGVDAPFPSYMAKQMLTHLGMPGDEMVSAKASSPLIAAHAVVQANGDLALLLINKDPSNTCTTSVDAASYAPGKLSTTYFYGEGSTSIVQAAHKTGAAFNIALPPYSMTTIVLSPTAITTPAFTSSATTPFPFSVPGAKLEFTAKVTNTGAPYAGAVVKLELVAPNGAVVYAKSHPGLDFATNGAYTFTGSAYPSTPGIYCVVVQVYAAATAQLLYSNTAATVTINPQDTATYNFETGTQGWTTSGGMISDVTTSSAEAFAGLSALEVDFDGTGADIQDAYVNPSSSPTAGQTISFEVWIPADSTIDWIQPFALDSVWNWYGDWQLVSNLVGNAWNSFTITIPTTATMPLNFLGVQFDTTGAWSGKCYVDSIGW